MRLPVRSMSQSITRPRPTLMPLRSGWVGDSSPRRTFRTDKAKDFQQAKTSSAVPSCVLPWFESRMSEWVSDRGRLRAEYEEKGNSEEGKWDFHLDSLRATRGILRKDFGVRKIDPKNRVYWIAKEFYHKSDYLEFARDSADKGETPYWSSDDHKEINDRFNDIGRTFIYQRIDNPKFYSTYIEKRVREVQHLETFYGIQLDLETRVWRLKQKMKQLPLQHKIPRQELATLLLEFMEGNHFRRVLEDKESVQECAGCRVYARALKMDAIKTGQVTLRIRSSIEIDDESEVTGVGAIQVYVEYSPDDHWDYERIIYMAPKIMRVGELPNIIKRLGDRVEEAQAKCVDGIEFCEDCETAPLFTSIKGNKVCSHFCWTKTPEERKRYMGKDAAAAAAAADN